VIIVKANLLGSLPVYDPAFAEIRRRFESTDRYGAGKSGVA